MVAQLQCTAAGLGPASNLFLGLPSYFFQQKGNRGKKQASQRDTLLTRGSIALNLKFGSFPTHSPPIMAPWDRDKPWAAEGFIRLKTWASLGASEMEATVFSGVGGRSRFGDTQSLSFLTC